MPATCHILWVGQIVGTSLEFECRLNVATAMVSANPWVFDEPDTVSRLVSLRHVSFLSEEKMKNFALKVQRFLKSEDGPTAVEYAIMLALIVIVCLAAINAVGEEASSAFQEIAADLESARKGGVN